MYLTLLKRELSLYMAGIGDVLATPALYALAIGFYMLGQPYGMTVSISSAVAALWLAALLSLGLTQYRIWEEDVRDGTLEQWALLPIPLEGVVSIKMLAHWLMSGLPLVLLTPVLLLLLGVNAPVYLPLLYGSVALTALGSLAGALSARFASRQLLTLLLVFPLSIPVLIFGAAASLPDAQSGACNLLLGYTMFVVPLSVAVTAWGLRIALRS